MTGIFPTATDTFIQREVAQLTAMGFEVITLSRRRPKKAEQIGEARLKIELNTFYVFPCPAFKVLKLQLKQIIHNPKKYIQNLMLAINIAPTGSINLVKHLLYFIESTIVSEYIKSNNINHLHNHFADSSCTVAMLSAELGGFQYSFSIHGPTIFFEAKQHRLDEKLKRATFVRCISHFCRSQLYIWTPNKFWHKTMIAHCGIDIQNYQEVIHKKNATRLIFVGRLVHIKGIQILLDIMPKLIELYPNLELLIVGDGPDKIQFQNFVDSNHLKNNVKLLGYQTSYKVGKLLNSSDIFILPSFAEGVPVALMEAMASRLPVITTQLSGVPELVDSNNGILIDASDSASLYEAIIKLIEDPDLRNQLGRNGRNKIAQDFNLHTEVSKLADYFIKITQ